VRSSQVRGGGREGRREELEHLDQLFEDFVFGNIMQWNQGAEGGREGGREGDLGVTSFESPTFSSSEPYTNVTLPPSLPPSPQTTTKPKTN